MLNNISGESVGKYNIWYTLHMNQDWGESEGEGEGEVKEQEFFIYQ